MKYDSDDGFAGRSDGGGDESRIWYRRAVWKLLAEFHQHAGKHPNLHERAALVALIYGWDVDVFMVAFGIKDRQTVLEGARRAWFAITPKMPRLRALAGDLRELLEGTGRDNDPFIDELKKARTELKRVRVAWRKSVANLPAVQLLAPELGEILEPRSRSTLPWEMRRNACTIMMHAKQAWAVATRREPGLRIQARNIAEILDLPGEVWPPAA